MLGVDQYEKFSILFGDVYASTSWYKGPTNTFLEIPLLTAIKDVLYYQDGTDVTKVGAIRLIDSNYTNALDIATDILGKTQYTSTNGVVFTNGLKVTFSGDVYPTQEQHAQPQAK